MHGAGTSIYTINILLIERHTDFLVINPSFFSVILHNYSFLMRLMPGFIDPIKGYRPSTKYEFDII
jgi:hypothetical protein